MSLHVILFFILLYLGDLRALRVSLQLAVSRKESSSRIKRNDVDLAALSPSPCPLFYPARVKRKKYKTLHSRAINSSIYVCRFKTKQPAKSKLQRDPPSSCCVPLGTESTPSPSFLLPPPTIPPPLPFPPLIHPPLFSFPSLSRAQKPMPITTIPRTGTFAWGQSSSSLPLLATGTAAGALDESFSSEGKLEFWEIYPEKKEQEEKKGNKADGEEDFLIAEGVEEKREPLASFGVNSR